MNIKETPVLLLTGYLGSGKTTLVNKILANKKGIKFAVIVNDIGEVNIDADLIEAGGVVDQKDDSLVALQNGCICCTLKMDLVQQLNEIVSQQKFDYIVIEASGICEPAPIAQTICAYPQMYPDLAKKGKAVLDSIVTVVDARRMCDEFSACNDLLKKDLQEDDIENLLIQQIEFCNIILLNKVDDVSKEELGLVKKIIRSLQPKAEIIECNYGDVDLDKILNTGDFNFDKVATSASWIAEIEGHDDEEDEHEHHHDHDEHEHHHDHDEHCEHEHHHDHHDHCGCGHDHHDHHHADDVFDSWGMEQVPAISEDKLKSILDGFADEEKYGVILRAKGMIKDANSDDWFYFDLVPGENDIRRGDAEYTGKVCVIGAGLKSEELKKCFIA